MPKGKGIFNPKKCLQDEVYKVRLEAGKHPSLGHYKLCPKSRKHPSLGHYKLCPKLFDVPNM